MLFFLLVPWGCFLLWRIRRAYVFHSNELPAIVALHVMILVSFTMTLIDTPYAPSTTPTTPHGRVVGMTSLQWNPLLYMYANCALLLIPTAWTIWIQRRLVDLPMSIVQLLLLGGLVYWLSFAQLPDACDYSNPKVMRLSLCG